MNLDLLLVKYMIQSKVDIDFFYISADLEMDCPALVIDVTSFSFHNCRACELKKCNLRVVDLGAYVSAAKKLLPFAFLAFSPLKPSKVHEQM